MATHHPHRVLTRPCSSILNREAEAHKQQVQDMERELDGVFNLEQCYELMDYITLRVTDILRPQILEALQPRTLSLLLVFLTHCLPENMPVYYTEPEVLLKYIQMVSNALHNKGHYIADIQTAEYPC